MAPTNLERVEADRAALRDHLEFLETELSRHENLPLTRHEVSSYIAEVEEDRKLLIVNHNNIRHATIRGADMEPHVAEFRTLSQLASRVHSGFHGILMTFPQATRSPPRSAHHHQQQSIKLPPLELPKFSGNLQEWVSFRDLFTTAVHNSTLTKVEKLTQLKALLTGEAARQVRSLVLSDANYDIAWSSLKDRYENNRELLFSLIKRLLNQPALTAATATSLRSLVDTTKECLRSLEILTIPTQHWDAILIYILFSKLDSPSRELWEQSLPDTNIPTLTKMYDFIEQRARALAASISTGPSRPPPLQRPPTGHPPKPTQARVFQTGTSKCKLGCVHPHPLFKCEVFQAKPSTQRQEIIARLKLCSNCMFEGHAVEACKSKHNCRVCGKRHHTMVHLENTQQSSTPATTSTVSSHQTSQCHGQLTAGVLATANIAINSEYGGNLRRALIDPCSTNSLVTLSTATQLQLPTSRCFVPISGHGGNSCGVAKFITTFTFRPHFNSDKSYTITALVVDLISGKVPSDKLKNGEWRHLEGLQLADRYYDKPGKVDILLGTDIAWSLLENERIDGEPGEPAAIKTTLGWIVAGPNTASGPVITLNTQIDLDQQLRRFWEQESIPEESSQTKEERECEQHFRTTHQRLEDGRFLVSLPLKNRPVNLGNSREIALKRFYSMERKFVYHTNLQDTEKIKNLEKQWNAYKDFMSEYEALGHMEVVPPADLHSKQPVYYIPHHSVLKESSTTTKLRVVFDASCKSSNGMSLNDNMMVGPQLQDNIWDIMLRFRCHLIAYTADVCKMYRQILVNKEEVDLQRIFWRDHPMKAVQEYRLLTVTYGTASAPYLAVKSLQQLAQDEKHRFPMAAEVTLHDFYIDDVASGRNTLSDARETVTQLIHLCRQGGFDLRKWTSNSQSLLESIPEELRETKSLIELSDDSSIKTLGIFWNPVKDHYTFKLSLPEIRSGKYTKRTILSEIAKIYDPIGWLAPAIIVCKLFMQQLWLLKHDWDDILPTEIQDKWISIRISLQELESLNIPRCIIHDCPSRLFLLGYSDASIKALSAAIYVFAEYDNQPSSCHLLTAKTKVAPVQHVTLPRLELNAAVLLSELIKSTQESSKLAFAKVKAFVDSTITLHWIQSTPTRWKMYIRRRVQTIHDNTPNCKWFHIPGEINPADCASRGISSTELIAHQRWWHGAPEFTGNPTPELIDEESITMEKEAQVKVHKMDTRPLLPVFTKFASFRKLQRIVAYVVRFYYNYIRKRTYTPMQLGHLTVYELFSAHNIIIRQVQRSQFGELMTALQKGKPTPSNCAVLSLSPFIEADGLLRVGGRLRHAAIPTARRHPLLLPKGHPITTSIIRDHHVDNFHAGASATLSFLHQRYWITNARDTIRMVIRKCVTCTRQRKELLTQIMGDLPPHRINQCKPFAKVGVDYAGPISIKPMVRSKITLKSWLAVFVCLTTKAIHIEIVSSLTTDCFLASFRRFVSRRGKPTDIFSDQGTNFKGADRSLREFFVVSQQEKVIKECSSQGITWHFNPPGAPHFGGLWEAGVKSIKHHLVRVSGSSLLTYEEFLTLCVQVEGILNSRPLTAASSDPSDLEVLTPAHFLIGQPITATPEPNLMDIKENHLQRWQRLQQQQQQFWHRWSNEYLTRLQQRPKWMKASRELQVGDLVIIKDERLPPMKWKMGRVINVHPGPDGHVRVATLKTADGEMKRPIVKLCLLPVADEVA